MSNFDRLTEAGIIPQGYDKLSDDERATIDNMSADEVESVIDASSKMDWDFLKKHVSHGMSY